MKTLPVVFLWTDSGEMRPLPQYRRTCDRQFVIGEQYTLEIASARSQQSHDHYFATIYDSWDTLPERLREQFPSAEHLRHYALVKTGYFTVDEVVCDTTIECVRWAKIVRKSSPYAVIVRAENTLRIYYARSQSAAVMKGDEFQESKTKVLDFIASLIGTTRQAMIDNARTTS